MIRPDNTRINKLAPDGEFERLLMEIKGGRTHVNIKGETITEPIGFDPLTIPMNELVQKKGRSEAQKEFLKRIIKIRRNQIPVKNERDYINDSGMKKEMRKFKMAEDL